jgi:hypothetical protein
MFKGGKEKPFKPERFAKFCDAVRTGNVKEMQRLISKGWPAEGIGLAGGGGVQVANSSVNMLVLLFPCLLVRLQAGLT